MKGRLNLATRRFGNERAPMLALSVLAVLLLGVSARHALAIQRLLPSQSSALHKEVASLESELAKLRKESADLRAGPRPEKARLEEWQLVKDLVDRRVFRWTRLFARLAGPLPKEARIVGITPTIKQGVVRLDLETAMPSTEMGLAFLQTLESRPEFKDVFPTNVTSRDGDYVFRYEMVYLADAPEPAASPSPSPAQADAPPAEDAQPKAQGSPVPTGMEAPGAPAGGPS